MSFAVRGITHCENCGTTLNTGEFVLCSKCQAEKDEEERKQEELRKRSALKAEVVEEVRANIKVDLLKELVTLTSIKEEIDEIVIQLDKPSGITYDEWYADLGNQVIQKCKEKSSNSVLINFIKEDIDD